MNEAMYSCDKLENNDKLDGAYQAYLGCMGGAVIGILMIFAMLMLGSKLAAYAIGAVIYIISEALCIKYDTNNKSISWVFHLGFTFSICLLFIGLLT